MVETVYQLPVPCRIALIADSHNRPVPKLLESLEKNKPDIICIAGDFIVGNLPEKRLKIEESQNALELIRQCVSFTWTCLSFGNHEWLLADEDIDVIKSTGIHVLDNSWIRKDGIVFGGLNSGSLPFYRNYRMQQVNYVRYPGKFPAPRAFTPTPVLAWMEEYERQPGYKVLLCHQPEYYIKYLRRKEINLILSGHAHGGQIRLGKHGLYAPDQGLFPKLTSGVYENRLVISRGIVNSSRIPRLNNPPEIVYIVPNGE